jgi:hypothetical protein
MIEASSSWTPVERRAVTGVELRGILHHDDRGFDGIDRRAARRKDGPAGAKGLGEIGAGFCPIGFAQIELGHDAAAAVDRESRFAHGKGPSRQ